MWELIWWEYSYNTKALDMFLADGWEPFAVTVRDVNIDNGVEKIWLRRRKERN